jgi:hypothetical protein
MSTVYPGGDPWGGTYNPQSYNPYSYSLFGDPWGGFMRGAADVLSAAGSYAVRVQTAA